MTWVAGRSARAHALMAVLCALAMGVVAAGCGDSSSDSTATSSASGGASKKHVKIAFFKAQTASPFVASAQWGADDAAAADGNAKVVANGPPTATVSATSSFAQNLLTSSQPDGYVTSPCLPSAWTSVYPELARTVPNGNVLGYLCNYVGKAGQTPPKGAETYVGANQGGANAYALVKQAIQTAGLGPDTTGTALVAACAKIPVFIPRVDAYVAALKAMLPKVRRVTFATSFVQNEANAAWSSAIAKESRSHIVFAVGACDTDNQAILLLKSRGVAGGKWAAAAYEPDSVAEAKAIADGRFAAGLTESGWVQGYVSTKLLIDGARGTPAPKGWVDTSNVLITKDNAQQYVDSLRSAAGAKKFYEPIASKIVASPQSYTKPLDASLQR